jgi:hypothetical protein
VEDKKEEEEEEEEAEAEKEEEEKEEKEDEKEEKEDEKEEKEEECSWIVPFPNANDKDTINNWFKSLDDDKLAAKPDMVFEKVGGSTISYVRAKEDLLAHVAVLETVSTLGCAGKGYVSNSLTFMCPTSRELFVHASGLMEAGYIVDSPLFGSQILPSEAVYMVTARKSKTRLRKVSDPWKKQFPESNHQLLQSNDKMCLTLEQQVAIWFLACAGPNQVWQFNALNFPFFSQAAIAMGLSVQMLCTERANAKIKQGTKPAELARGFLEHKDCFRGYDEAQVALTILALSTQRLQNAGWFMQGTTPIAIPNQGEELKLLKDDPTFLVSENAIELKREVKAGHFGVFRGHWMPTGVDSPVESAVQLMSLKWKVTRVLVTKELHIVSSLPQPIDYMERTSVRKDAHVWLYPVEDEKNEHVTFKWHFMKDAKQCQSILLWLPKNERAFNGLKKKELKQKQMFLLATRFRQQHGESITLAHKEALKKFESTGYLERQFEEADTLVHLQNMYRHMQLADKKHLDDTTIRMDRLRFFHQTAKELLEEKKISIEEYHLMDNEAWKMGGEAVFKSVSEWGNEVLGPDYALVRDGMYGPHGLLCSTTLPQRLHLDSVGPFFSGME